MAENWMPDGVSALCEALRKQGYEAYPVGGCVRDLLLGRTPADWDVATAALPEVVQACFSRTAPTGLGHGTITVWMGEERIEVTTFRRETGYSDARRPDRVSFGVGLTEDLSRRDFTVNAMALGADGAVIDPFGGQADGAAGLLRCVGDADRRFCEDALRMLRAVRFSAQLGFQIERETAAAIKRNVSRAAYLSGERIRVELEKTLLSQRPGQAEQMVASGLLDALFDQWHAERKWSILAQAPATPVARWRAFCAVTGFPIAALPVERKLRRAVEHPEQDAIKELTLSGGALCALGLTGKEVGRMQRRLAAHIEGNPGDNTREKLVALAEDWINESKKL